MKYDQPFTLTRNVDYQVLDDFQLNRERVIVNVHVADCSHYARGHFKGDGGMGLSPWTSTWLGGGITSSCINGARWRQESCSTTSAA